MVKEWKREEKSSLSDDIDWTFPMGFWCITVAAEYLWAVGVLFC